MILCCGEALIDMLPRKTAAGEDAFVPHPGGAIFNTAVALGRLDVDVAMMTGLSTDMFGAQLRNALEASNVDTSVIVESDRPTTLAFVQLTDGVATYHFVDENSAGRMLKVSDLPELPTEASALYFGGISLACEPGAEAYETFALDHCERLPLMIDPNIRPAFITEEARYRARIDRMIRQADIVKVSDDDLDWIIPGDTELMDKAQSLLAMGPRLVVVTRGGAGATALLPKGRAIAVSAQPAEVVDTVGAGDTFNAGLMASLSEQGSLTKEGLASLEECVVKRALSFGARVAAITVSRAGANPPWASDLNT